MVLLIRLTSASDFHESHELEILNLTWTMAMESIDDILLYSLSNMEHDEHLWINS